MRTFREDEWASLIGLLNKLDMMCDIQEKVSTACNCSFLYWHRVILPTYFANLYESKMDLHRLMVRNTFFMTFLNISNGAQT
jgi:WASH complex subunit 7